MEELTEEKGLVKLDNSLLAKMRRFIANVFTKKTNENFEVNEDEKDEKQEHECEYEQKEELEQKLLNYYASIKKLI